jgi:hypothetical protein
VGVLPHLLAIEALHSQRTHSYFLPGIDVWFGTDDSDKSEPTFSGSGTDASSAAKSKQVRPISPRSSSSATLASVHASRPMHTSSPQLTTSR